MGIQGLLPFLKKSSRVTNLSEFKGKTAAVDAYSWLHKGAFSCAEKLVKGEPTDGYIVYVMKQINLLLSFNIKPILVFDGCHLPSKSVTEVKRRENRVKNRRKAKELLREGKLKEARECFQRCVDVSPTMAHEVIKACRARNIDTIVAPYEADAQLAYLNICGLADVVITEDSDLVVFGCKKILFKVDSNGGGVLIENEKLYLSMNLPRNKFDFVKFRYMCVLSGCDYLPSLHGIGLAKSCKFFVVTTNPDIFNALARLPSHLKMPSLEVSLEYREGFMKAVNTIIYQLVFDPISKKLRPLNEYPPHLDHNDLPYCGEFIGHEMALQIALGNLDVQTKETIDSYDPLSSKCPEIKSSGWHQKGNLVSSHPSIWNPNFQTLKYSLMNSEKINEEKIVPMIGKQCSIQVPFTQKKRKAVVEDEETNELSEEYLESLYSQRSPKKIKMLKSDQSANTTNAEEQILNDDEFNDFFASCEKPLNENNETVRKSLQLEEVIVPVKRDVKMFAFKQVLSSPKEEVSDVKMPRNPFAKKMLDDQNMETPTDNFKQELASPKNELPSVKVSRNPFAKKALLDDQSNKTPASKGYSALRNFATSTSTTIVHSRYFGTPSRNDQNIKSRREISPTVNKCNEESSPIKTIFKMENNAAVDHMDISPPANTALLSKNINNNSLEMKKPNNSSVKTKSSFKWGRLSDMFSYSQNNRSPSNSKCNTSGRTLFATPPPSQNKENILGARNEDLNLSCNNLSQEKDSPCSNKSIDYGSPDGLTNILTPPEPDESVLESNKEGQLFHSSTPGVKSKIGSRAAKQCTPMKSKCRASGLKKSSSSFSSKQKQLSLKDMFGFKKAGPKLPSTDT